MGYLNTKMVTTKNSAIKFLDKNLRPVSEKIRNYLITRAKW